MTEYTAGNTPASPRRTEGVTICIPNWNHRCFLPRCVSSAMRAVTSLAAHGVESEILVVDDVSRDGSRPLLISIMQLYPEAPIRVIFQARNGGPSRARNTAIAAARYRHICMLDADNTLEHDNLIYFHRALRDTGASMVYGNLLTLANGRPFSFQSNYIVGNGIVDSNYIDSFCVVDAEAFELLGGYIEGDRMDLFEDWEMVLHLFSEGHLVCFVPMVLGHYHKYTLSRFGGLGEEYANVKQQRAMRRRFDQIGVRSNDHRFSWRIYHPDMGFLS